MNSVSINFMKADTITLVWNFAFYFSILLMVSAGLQVGLRENYNQSFEANSSFYVK